MLFVKGDCLDKMRDIASGSIDMVLADPPYGTTACKWDTRIPFEPLWEQLHRVCKPNAAMLFFGSEPFSTAQRNSNIKNFRYDWIWDKTKGGNFALAKKQPMKCHEVVSIFYKTQPTYNPQMEARGRIRKKGGGKASDNFGITPTVSYNNTYYPKSIICFSTGSRADHHHPTQKPVALLEYLIKTYTNEGDTVLDPTMGSGSTGVACRNLGRKFIGIEMDEKYYEIARTRCLA